MQRRTWALALGLALLSMGATPDRASNPYDAEQRRLTSEAVRSGRSARAVLPLLSLMRNSGLASPEVTRDALERLSRERRLSAAVRAYAGHLLARVQLRAGETVATAETITELGYVTDFQVIGPFDNEGKAGFDRRDPAEALMAGGFAHDATFAGKERDVSMRPYPNVSNFGYVNFDTIFRPYENVCSFAYTTVTAERAAPLALWTGAGGAVKLYWNGDEVLKDEGYRQPSPDRSVVVVPARQGHNRLGVKVCITSSTWGFYLRVTAPDGAPAQGVKIAAGVMPAIAAPPAQAVSVPAAPPTPFKALESAAEGPRAKPGALEDFARFLAWTGADDPAEHRARQLAARAADEAPTFERLELAAILASQRGEAMRFVAEASRRFGGRPETLLLEAKVRSTSLRAADALPLLERITGASTKTVEAELLRATVLAEMGLAQSARAAVDRAAALAPNAHDILRTQVAYAEQAGASDSAIEHARRAIALRWDDTQSRRTLIADALVRRDDASLDEQLAVVHQLSADSGTALSYVAAVQDARGKEAESLALRQEARALAPHDADAVVGIGRYLLRLGQRDAAADALREALALRPQDAGTRELLEQLRPEPRPDERLAIDSETLLSRRGEANGYPSTTLQDLTVNTVFRNGLGTSFHQVAMQVHDDEGARRLRTYGIQYDPSSQRVEVRLARVYRANGQVLEGLETFEQSLGEPWYRIYYDTRALVVVFPNLEPGDTIELRYRIDDVTHRNVFADYYGDLHYLDITVPKKHVEYVLITPKSRQMYFNEPRLPGLQHEQRVEGDTRIDRFFADDVPAVRPENGMPGPTETHAYLHVSTYRSWEDVGKWYWGLIRDQLYADASLKRTVAELVAGAPDVETKVERIHAWVIDNTRYVGLEFGIHGYKPYRVPQIVERGFGDCKDKASLLYTMLREAGIDAHVVLVRTRRNGAIPELPASLAVFDHAIAYVPALDLYIDGTAEHSGMRELPEQDQGVTVLHVWPEGSELRRTPDDAPAENARTRRIDAALAADGSGTIEVVETVRGVGAAYYRSVYQAPGTRAERLERSLRATFPGLRLESQSFESLARTEPIRLRYRAVDPQLAAVDGNHLRVDSSSLTGLLRQLASAPRRQHALELGAPNAYAEERRVTLPPGARVESLPEGGVAESSFGRVSVSVTRDGAAVVARTELEIRADRVSAEQYPSFRQWVEQADQLLRQRINIEANR